MKKLIAAIMLAFATAASAYTTTGFYVREYYTTFGYSQVKVCVYNVNGDEMGFVRPVMSTCPMQVQIEM